MKRFTFAGLVAAAATSFAVSAQAATFNVVDNPGGQNLLTENNIANFGSFGQTLQDGDSVSVTFDGANSLTSVGIGFDFSPVGASQGFELVFNSVDFGEFGPTTIYLSNSTSIADAFASDTITGPGDLAILSGTAATTPFFLLYEFSNASFGSFTGDVMVSLAPIPVPASGLMLGGLALAGAAWSRKRRTA